MDYEGYERSKNWSDSGFAAYTPAEASQFAAEIDLLPLGCPPRRILDIGFGNGAFMGWARAQGWVCDGIEVNPRLVDRAKARGFEAGETLRDLLDAGSGQPYDIITAFDVLEHIERTQLVEFLISLGAACHSKTVMFFRFPNGDNPFALPLQNGDVTHRLAIGQAMIRQVAELASVKVLAIRAPQLALSGVSWKRRAAIMTGLPLRWICGQAIRYLFMGGISVTFSGNLVAVLQPG